jgi:tRNA G10  N-methylase Trm11
MPPFTVFNAREGFWQDRKRRWISYGIKSEVGRDAKAFNNDAWMAEKADGTVNDANGVSVFDPVLCEILYRWFTPKAGLILDPFAGGSVRGVVASLLGFQYWGCDLRAEQVEANREQARTICKGLQPIWVCGDSRVKLEEAPKADFLFSCPPYGSLEKYSDMAEDLSAMGHDDFLNAYADIIRSACERLHDNRFACFVVGDFRDGRGLYRNFVSDTIQAFRRGGLGYYNEAILLTSVGSACMRVTKQFEASRKFAKVHQNVLVFVKGDPSKAAKAINKEGL